MIVEPLSLGLIAVLALVLAVVAIAYAYLIWRRTYNLIKRLELGLGQLSSPIRCIYSFELQLTDKFWDRLGLTAQERAFVNKNPLHVIHFSYEEWSVSFGRFRIATLNGAEWVADIHKLLTDSTGVHFWDIYLEDESGAPHVSLDWHRRNGTVRLYAYGGRFGGTPLPDGPEPEQEYIFLEIPVPFYKRTHLNYQYFQEPLLKYRVFDPPGVDLVADPSKGGTDIEPAGHELYRCDNPEKGFKWRLERNDLRLKIPAEVLRIRKKFWSRKVVGFDLKLPTLYFPGMTAWADPSVVEPDAVGQTTLHKGEEVWLVIDDYIKVDRIWPSGNFYTPLQCPQCKKDVIRTWDRHSDGVCSDCRPFEKCSQCENEFDPKFLTRETGFLVCSRKLCKEMVKAEIRQSAANRPTDS